MNDLDSPAGRAAAAAQALGDAGKPVTARAVRDASGVSMGVAAAAAKDWNANAEAQRAVPSVPDEVIGRLEAIWRIAYTSALAAFDTERAGWQSKIEHAEAEREGLAEDLERLEAERDEARKERDEASRETARVREQAAGAASEAAEALAAQRSRADKAEARAEAIEGERDRLIAERQVLQAERDQLRDSIRKQKD